VQWLLTLPPMRRMPRIRPELALRVSRFLSQVAGYSRVSGHSEDASAIDRLASDVWMLPKHYSGGAVASKWECLRFLEDFAPYLPNHDCSAVIAFLKALDRGALKSAPKHSSETHVEYLSARPLLGIPAAAYYPALLRRKKPSDDLTERIRTAVDAMEAAKCRRPVVIVAELLEREKVLEPCFCTVQHVTSRLRAVKNHVPLLEQEFPLWLHCFWLTRDPQNLSKTESDPDWPDHFEFERCDC